MCKSEFDKDMERFKIVLATRNFEIELFWKRSSYFLALNTALATALAAGLFALPDESERELFGFLLKLLGGICFVGSFICFAWMRVTLGSKYWSSHWEQVIIKEQKYIGFCQSEHRDYFSIEGPDKRVEENLFPRSKIIGCLDARYDKRVEENLSLCGKIKRWLDTRYNGHVLMKPSVSRWMFKTAYVFFYAWGAGFFWVLWMIFG